KRQGKMAFKRKLAKNSEKLARFRPAKVGDSWQARGARARKPLLKKGSFARRGILSPGEPVLADLYK
ncbi:hypothetical protein A2U01_0100176, partial [Trifolium medium]|nr:hypothetical protein [Trifolium medium]